MGFNWIGWSWIERGLYFLLGKNENGEWDEEKVEKKKAYHKLLINSWSKGVLIGLPANQDYVQDVVHSFNWKSIVDSIIYRLLISPNHPQHATVDTIWEKGETKCPSMNYKCVNRVLWASGTAASAKDISRWQQRLNK